MCIYHARISEQMNGEGLPSHFICLRSERDKSVYLWSMGSYLLYNATIVEEIQQKTNLIFSEARRSAFRNLVYFVNRYRNHSADGLFEDRRYDNAFRCKIIFSRLSVCESNAS